MPWRPLYELQDRILYSKTEHLGLNWFPKYVPGFLWLAQTFMLVSLLEYIEPRGVELSTSAFVALWRFIVKCMFPKCPFIWYFGIANGIAFFFNTQLPISVLLRYVLM